MEMLRINMPINQFIYSESTPDEYKLLGGLGLPPHNKVVLIDDKKMDSTFAFLK